MIFSKKSTDNEALKVLSNEKKAGWNVVLFDG
jgi:hypothetical protein